MRGFAVADLKKIYGIKGKEHSEMDGLIAALLFFLFNISTKIIILQYNNKIRLDTINLQNKKTRGSNKWK